jgi:hypothetical protein
VKFLCSGCNRLLDVERFRLEGSSLVVTCQSCRTENHAGQTSTPTPAPTLPSNVTPLRTPTIEAISRAASAANEKTFEVPPGHCPKCVAKRAEGALACPSCGLVFAQVTPRRAAGVLVCSSCGVTFDQTQAKQVRGSLACPSCERVIEQSPANEFDPSPWLKGRWLQLLGTWGDDATHEAVRIEAMNEGELAQLGRLYRLRLADQPEDPYALRGRDEVLRLAVLPQISARQLKGGEQDVPTWKYVALSAVILGCLLALFFLVRQMLMLS